MQQSSRNITHFGATVILVFSPRHGNGPVHISWRYKHAENSEFLNHDFTLSISGGHSLVVGPLGIHSVSTYILPVLIGKLFPTHGFTFPLWSWVLWCSTWRSLASGSTFYYGPWRPLQCSLCWWVGRCCDPGSSPWHIWHPRWNPSPGDPVPSPNLQLRGFGHFAKGAGSSPQESGLVSVIFGICPGSLGSPFSQACNPPKL